MDQKIIAVLRKLFFLNWPYDLKDKFSGSAHASDCGDKFMKVMSLIVGSLLMVSTDNGHMDRICVHSDQD